MALFRSLSDGRESAPLFLPLAGVFVFSGVVNLLALSGPLFMLEVYDRVIPSRSGPTLVALLMLAAGLYAFSGLLELVRNRVLSRIAGIFDNSIFSRVASVIAGASLRGRTSGDILRPAQDVDLVRSFVSGPGPAALFDLPWMPLYLVICFFLHPWIGLLAAVAMTLLIALTIAADVLTKPRVREIGEIVSARNRFGEAIHRNAEAVAAMGFLARAEGRLTETHERSAELQRNSAAIAGLFSGVSKTVRQMVQSGTLALGAWLVIQGDLTGGSIVAASTILARALQPIEQVIANWRNMIAANQAWQRLKETFKQFPEEQPRTQLPPPSKLLSVESLFVAPPGMRERITVKNVTFQVEAGTAVGIIGPSASGKSSLVRTITGVWPEVRGKVSLDGASLDQWPAAERGRHIGYMPQSLDLFPGTIAENIARLDRQADHSDTIAAAKEAGAHDMIVGLIDGYETQVGEAGQNLSAGQRQRVALARALFGNPFLVVLDEPNSNLDVDGDKALAGAITRVKRRGGIVIVVSHRNSVLLQIDKLLVMENGLGKAFGPRDAILKSIQENQQRAVRNANSPALTVVEGERQ
ncbi:MULTISPECIES: type I secretion system permease/ATPase [unclassified Rhizobium]|uniref:type I secretion system permease/ATPase n=1 Tax=unclassified Rhizobium TaxID=2613769 RepID=UPI00104DA7F5|nr:MULTISPECIES: type I secretion system permease/ATPase [unclassified Rhizobium]MBB4171954.1 PrtD family type I secretion system ABC transporter [Rhizobium sp. BK538]TCM63366.1 PrtD family type I secretion system ABC transporter [Rhizobium sp. BK068]